MPVRIYDISKKLGLENKDIISKAKALGITAAKVASSSLDKITAEFLEEEILKEHPEIAAKLNAPKVEAPKPPPIEEMTAPDRWKGKAEVSYVGTSGNAETNTASVGTR